MGTGTSSGRSAGGANATTSTTGTPATLGSLIDRTSIKSNGNGTWSFDIDGVGGGQILDETGGSRDPMAGMGGKVYSVTVWDADYNMIGTRDTFFSPLNAVKRELRDRLKQHYGLFG